MSHVSAAAPRSPFWVQGEAQQQRGGCRVLSSLLPWSSPGDVGTASGCLRVCWVRFWGCAGCKPRFLLQARGQHVML